MTLWEKIAALSGEVVKEQGLASVDQPMSNDLFRFLHYLQEKAEADAGGELFKGDQFPFVEDRG